jgi:voltage-dependent calcium channel N type alpha-1B
VIGISTIFLCMDFYGISEEIANILSTSNTFFIVFFVCEGSMKIIAYGFKYYWYINWNKFDFIVVFLSLVVVDESWLENLGINASALRIIRVMRLFRLIKVSDSLRSLLKTIIIAMANIFTTALLLLLLLFTFSIVGMSLFGDQPDGENFDDNANFKTFYNSMFLLFRCSTGESWNSVMHDTYEH